MGENSRTVQPMRWGTPPQEWLDAHPNPLGTWWNGEPTIAYKCRVIVGKSLRPTWWCADLEGVEREAVAVVYDGHKFFLDNEDGSGWRKVTTGYGSPEYRHLSLPDDSKQIEALNGDTEGGE